MSDTLSIKDNRTGKDYEVEIVDGNISARALRQIKEKDGDFGMMSYDPGYLNTACCTSRITDLHGDEGILRYRGYPIEQLAEKTPFLDVAYLLFNGELPTAEQSKEFTQKITDETVVNDNVKTIMSGFKSDAHPMGVFISMVSALSAFFPDSKDVTSKENRMLQASRLLAKTPIIAAYAYRNSKDLPHVEPKSELSYTGNFLNMMFSGDKPDYEVNPVLERALDILFTLHADHEQNCSTSAMRNIASSQADPFVSVAGAAAALYGPSHGGANEAVLNMLREIGSVENVADYVKRCKGGELRLMGFGHRVYKNYDPRARIVKQVADEVFEVTGRNPLIDVAMELERIALEDDYFVKRNLYPNVDFYSGLIYEAMGFPMESFTVLFAIPRTSGWLSQWMELMEDPEFRITRPRQNYQGSGERQVPDNYKG